MTDSAKAHDDFAVALGDAKSAEAAFLALYHLTQVLFGVRLFTVMTVDMEEGLARRAFTSDPESYPGSGTKPIERNSWFEIVHDRGEVFVANTLEDIAGVFADHELIGSLGCGSVMNLPVFDDGALLATVNLLDREGYFTPDRVQRILAELSAPSFQAVRIARDTAKPVQGEPT
ncbi:MAG: GAF domain-containing protein [Alphaproteobacteria bacterium]|nr:GAF domain-containing protein [Alphaproteobacteria bacterium]